MLTNLEAAVLNQIDQNKTEIIAFLQQLIRFKTVTPQDRARAEGDEFVAHQQLVQQFLNDMGFATELWEAEATDWALFPGGGVFPDRDLSNMPIVVGQRTGRGGGKSLLLNGHYDVVPVGDITAWRYDPFAAELVGGRVYGRGTTDMKGGLTAMLMAIRYIQAAGVQLKGDLIVEVVPDEEATCMGTLACCKRGYTADAAIIPEPTNMNVLVAMRGSLYGTISVFGRAGHADWNQPHWTKGGAVNAIEKAMKVIAGLEALTAEWAARTDRQHKFLSPDKITPTLINGGEWPVTYPERVDITFGAQFIPGVMNKEAEIQAKLDAIAAEDDWLAHHPPQLTTGEWLYGAEVAEDAPIVTLATAVLSDLGHQPKLIGYDSLTDAVHLINYAHIPTISIGPGGHQAHSVDEYIELEQLLATTKALALAIMRWCEVI